MESYHVQHWMQAKEKGRKVWANKIAFPKQVKELSTFGKELIAIVKNKEVLYRLDINEESNCFFTLKDHKENFHNNPTVRLINPAKNEIGRIRKVILDTINSSLIKQIRINQWKNTHALSNDL